MTTVGGSCTTGWLPACVPLDCSQLARQALHAANVPARHPLLQVVPRPLPPRSPHRDHPLPPRLPGDQACVGRGRRAARLGGRARRQRWVALHGGTAILGGRPRVLSISGCLPAWRSIPRLQAPHPKLVLSGVVLHAGAAGLPTALAPAATCRPAGRGAQGDAFCAGPAGLSDSQQFLPHPLQAC